MIPLGINNTIEVPIQSLLMFPEFGLTEMAILVRPSCAASCTTRLHNVMIQQVHPESDLLGRRLT